MRTHKELKWLGDLRKDAAESHREYAYNKVLLLAYECLNSKWMAELWYLLPNPELRGLSPKQLVESNEYVASTLIKQLEDWKKSGYPEKLLTPVEEKVISRNAKKAKFKIPADGI